MSHETDPYWDPTTTIAKAQEKEESGDREGATVHWTDLVDNGWITPVTDAAREQQFRFGDLARAEELYRLAASRSDGHALGCWAQMREKVGDREGAEALAWQAADNDWPHTVYNLAQERLLNGDSDSAKALYRQAADRGYATGLTSLAHLLLRYHDLEGIKAIAREAADTGNTEAVEGLRLLAVACEEGEFPEGAAALRGQ